MNNILCSYIYSDLVVVARYICHMPLLCLDEEIIQLSIRSSTTFLQRIAIGNDSLELNLGSYVTLESLLID